VVVVVEVVGGTVVVVVEVVGGTVVVVVDVVGGTVVVVVDVVGGTVVVVVDVVGGTVVVVVDVVGADVEVVPLVANEMGSSAKPPMLLRVALMKQGCSAEQVRWVMPEFTPVNGFVTVTGIGPNAPLVLVVNMPMFSEQSMGSGNGGSMH
jgi:hypothetical protein